MLASRPLPKPNKSRRSQLSDHYEGNNLKFWKRLQLLIPMETEIAFVATGSS